jgi:hypothetical protein
MNNDYDVSSFFPSLFTSVRGFSFLSITTRIDSELDTSNIFYEVVSSELKYCIILSNYNYLVLPTIHQREWRNI